MQAAANAAERRARDDAGCACGLQSGTHFSNEDIVAIENGQQDVSASSRRLMVSTDPDRAAQRHVQHSTRRSRLNSIASGSGPNKSFQQEGRRTEHKQSQKYSIEAGAMEDVVDLTIDSDGDSVQ